MFGFTRWTIMLAMIVVSAIFTGITVGIAQTPPADPDAQVQEAIKSALQGKEPAPGSAAIPEDVARIFSRQGSVLDGSSLDPDLEFGTKASEASAGDSERAFAAEMLLKSSRKLEGIGPADKTRQELVAKMRSEAVRLLSE